MPLNARLINCPRRTQRVREVLSSTFSQPYWQTRGRQGASRFAAEPDPQHVLRAQEAATASAVAQECAGTCPAAYDQEQHNLTRARLIDARTSLANRRGPMLSFT